MHLQHGVCIVPQNSTLYISPTRKKLDKKSIARYLQMQLPLHDKLGPVVFDITSIRADLSIRIPLRETLERLGIRRDRVRNQLGVDLPRVESQVAQIIANLVVVGIVPVASLATKHGLFVLCLDTPGTSRDTAARDPVADEPIIVAAAIKGNECVVQALLLVPVNVQLLQLG